jgi:hypothetical protein
VVVWGEVRKLLGYVHVKTPSKWEKACVFEKKCVFWGPPKWLWIPETKSLSGGENTPFFAKHRPFLVSKAFSQSFTVPFAFSFGEPVVGFWEAVARSWQSVKGFEKLLARCRKLLSGLEKSWKKIPKPGNYSQTLETALETPVTLFKPSVAASQKPGF